MLPWRSAFFFFLGIEVFKEKARVILTQRKFAMDLIKEYNSDSYSSFSSVLLARIKLSMNKGISLGNPLSYRNLIGKLNYLTHTRNDISFTV